MWKERRGFSLIELVITIALLGILVGSAAVMFGYLRYADTKEAAERVNMELSNLRIDTMSKTGDRKYLYIYLISGDGYYLRVLDKEPEDIETQGMLNAEGTRLCGMNVTISKSEGGGALSASEPIWVAYTKSGLFFDGSAECIEIRGRGTYTIRLDGVSGRHYFK